MHSRRPNNMLEEIRTFQPTAEMFWFRCLANKLRHSLGVPNPAITEWQLEQNRQDQEAFASREEKRRKTLQEAGRPSQMHVDAWKEICRLRRQRRELEEKARQTAEIEDIVGRKFDEDDAVQALAREAECAIESDEEAEKEGGLKGAFTDMSL